MGRKPKDSEIGCWFISTVILMATISCLVVYVCFSVAFRPGVSVPALDPDRDVGRVLEEGESCCSGIEHLELWGDVVKWGSDFRVNSSKECCRACRAMCRDEDAPCACDSWVFCGNKKACGSHFGECWLKKQKDSLGPVRREAGDHVSWTSGLIFGKEVGIVGLETGYGMIRIKLLPDRAPHSVSYILEVLTSKHCLDCHFYRAEGRGGSWDEEGKHIKNAPFGPPFALVQGVLQAGVVTEIPKESEKCPGIERGSVGWVSHGPEFFISLADHHEWRNQYTVFGSVVAGDMGMVEEMVQQETEADTWDGISVRMLKKPIPLRFKRIKPRPTAL